MSGSARVPAAARDGRLVLVLAALVMAAAPMPRAETGDAKDLPETLEAVDAGSVAADPQATTVVAGEAPRLRMTGDALLRFESVRRAPNPETSDFERARLRIRPGLEASIGGRVTAGAGLRASLASDSNNENDIRIDNFISDEVTLDRAYVGIAGSRTPLSVTLGVFVVPFTGTEVLWDRDIRFQGVGGGIELPPAGGLVAQRLQGGASLGSQDHEDESVAAAVRWEAETGGGFSFGAAFWHFGGTDALVEAGYARTNRLDPDGGDLLSDYEIAQVTLGWEWVGAEAPLRFRLDVIHNAGADDRRSGLDFRVDWGEIQPRTGSWRLRLMLQRIEQDAALAAFGGDEWWFRTDQRGARLGVAVSIGPRVVIELSGLRQRRDGLDDWLARGWIDFTVLL